MNVAVTYADNEGTILYCNPIAVERPTKTPRKVGMNIRDCHKEETDKTVDVVNLIFMFRSLREKGKR
jgi:hypothetical protein